MFSCLTARVTRLGWEGGFALETGFRASQEKLKNAVHTPSRVHALLAGIHVAGLTAFLRKRMMKTPMTMPMIAPIVPYTIFINTPASRSMAFPECTQTSRLPSSDKT